MKDYFSIVYIFKIAKNMQCISLYDLNWPCNTKQTAKCRKQEAALKNKGLENPTLYFLFGLFEKYTILVKSFFIQS